MTATNADAESAYRDQILGRLPEDSTCRSAIVLKNTLVAVQLYIGHLPNYESSMISLYNYRTNKLMKSIKVGMGQAPSNLQQHTLLTDPSNNLLIVCDDYGIFIYSLQRSLKIFGKLSANHTLVESPLTCARISQPMTRIKVFGSEELLIAKGSSILKWNYYQERSGTHLKEFLTFPLDKKIADFECDNDKQLLFVMLELLFTYENSEILIYDLVDKTKLSSYKLNCMFLNRFWAVDVEIGSVAVMQSDLVKKKSVITFLRIDADFELKKLKSHEVDGWTLHHLNNSKRLSCIIISKLIGNVFKRIWGYFEYAEDRFLKANYSEKEESSDGELPRVHKFFDYLDPIDCFVGNEGGSLFLSKRKRVVVRKTGYSSKKFWEYVKPSA